MTLKKARNLCAAWPLILRFRKWGGIKDLEALMGFQKDSLLDARSAPCPKEFGNSVPVALAGVKRVGGRESSTVLSSNVLGALFSCPCPQVGWWVPGEGSTPCPGSGSSGHFHVAEGLGGMGVHSGRWLVAMKAEARRGWGVGGWGARVQAPKVAVGRVMNRG